MVLGEQILKVVNDYQRLKKRMISSEFEFCRDAVAVCNIIVRDEIFLGIFPKLVRLCWIALSIPLATVWPEREFSTLCRVKTKQRNQLLDVTPCALINISINGPEHLNDEGSLEVA